MTDVKELLDFAINPYTKQVVKQAFNTSDKIIPIDSDIASFRLFKPNDSAINLEYLVGTPFGMAFEVVAQYFKDGRVLLPHKYFEGFKYAYGMAKLSISGISGYTTLDNALIAAFSVEALMIVQYGQDAKESINGLEIEFFRVEEGELNIYAHDRYGLNPNKSLAVGMVQNGELSINPTITYNAEYARLLNLGLLSMAKFIGQSSSE